MTLTKLSRGGSYWGPVLVYILGVFVICLLGFLAMVGKNYREKAVDEECPKGTIEPVRDENDIPEEEEGGLLSNGTDHAEQEMTSFQTQTSITEPLNGTATTHQSDQGISSIVKNLPLQKRHAFLTQSGLEALSLGDTEGGAT